MWGSSSLVQPVEVINGGRHIAQFSALLLCKLDLKVPVWVFRAEGEPEGN